VLVSQNAFFWDTLQLASRHAHWFYDNDFRSLMLPAELDSGHPPTFGLGLALLWKLFGRSLVVSHFAMLPFLIGIVLQAYQLVSRFVPRAMAPWGTLFVLAQPTLLAQSVLVSPDIVLVFLYLLALNALLGGRRRLLAAALAGLGLVSMRGMMSVAAIFLCDVVLAAFDRRRDIGVLPPVIARAVPAYVPAALLAGGWLAWHYAETGWIGYHPGSPWAPAFETVTLAGIIKNLAFLGWRVVDFGCVFLWITAAALLLAQARTRTTASPASPAGSRARMLTLLLLFAAPLLVYAPSLLLHAHLTAHRYLLAPLVLFNVFVFALVAQIASAPRRRALYAALLAALLTGHLWRYPESVSTGWDSTLAHLPYYGLRKSMLAYVRENDIAFERVGSAFPLLDSPRITDLADDTSRFHPMDLARDEYVLYASVINQVSDAELAALARDWTIAKEYRSGGLRVTLYRRPHS
jgi:hypothetical protein